MRTSLKGLLTPPIIIGATVIVALLAVVIFYVMTESKPSASFVTPTQGTLVQEVDTTGSVNAADQINLGFQTGGTISYAGPAVGTHVAAGATLGSLTSGTQEAALEQAKAALQTQQANLATIQAGSTSQQINVSQTSVSNAQASVEQAKQTLIATAQDAYAKADDAIVNRVDQTISNPHTANPSFNLTLTSSQDQSNIASGRIQMETLLKSWDRYLSSLSSNPDSVDTTALASTTQANLEAVNSYLNLVANGLAEAVPSSNYSSATIQGYESSVAIGRTNVTGSLTAIDNSESVLSAAQSSLASAQSQLSVTTAGATSAQIQAQEGQVAAAQAQVDAAQAQLSQTVIFAPIAGTITVNNMEPGQVAAAGTTQVTLISNSAFQFDTYVSEAQLAEIKVGDAAQVELDAYQTAAPLSAHVIEIDPAATVVGGVSSFEVKLQFDQNDQRISAGETGSMKITTESLSNVMSIPTSAIIMNNGQYFVIVKAGNGTRQVPVQLGIQSASGFTQITSGLSSTDEVQTFGNQ